MQNQHEHHALKNKHIVIMAGGTGGHIFPALAVADALVKQGATVSWLGTSYGLEKKLVENRFPLDFLRIKGVRKKGLFKKLFMPFSLCGAILQAMWFLKKRKTKIVLGFGGYASGPGGLAAKILFIPLIIHEQNAKPGMTNKALAKFANQVLCAFPVKGFSRSKKVQVIGNPIRDEIRALHDKDHDFYKHMLNVLVLGGSQGAQRLNQALPMVLKNLPTGGQVNIWHQSGQGDYEATLMRYQEQGLDAHTVVKVTPFIDNMAEAYAWADIVVCRAGASTVSEVAAAGIPAFFVPFPHAVDDHQYHNAQFLVQAEAAVCIRESYFNAEKLAAFIRAMDLNRQRLVEMSSHGKGVAHLAATEHVVSWVNHLIK
ncbi:undecaprenyldiphospho-muramoylpentapeptide beta-N-acetylglucosaminyltransferase [Facilibium subflavum]|uniref:undecaprenyldiphospho-muramoylpentapeptide beta-N-acetylglucosaminyltransferase n=1 Tax=Facilibium subflavum TaxID=2219058 RepID=UPI000E651066|nr:undecaprenyldiphospho-muramoylpentapeptide beta-N-acetylglucosaminyltransferase [Facilibium subflavum]